MPSYLVPLCFNYYMFFHLTATLHFFFGDCSFSKHGERCEIGKQAEGGAKHSENFKGLVSIWIVYDDAQEHIRIFWLCIRCTLFTFYYRCILEAKTRKKKKPYLLHTS